MQCYPTSTFSDSLANTDFFAVSLHSTQLHSVCLVLALEYNKVIQKEHNKINEIAD
jgi:hypothetical protein